MINEKIIDENILNQLKENFDEFTYIFETEERIHSGNQKLYKHPISTISLGYKDNFVYFHKSQFNSKDGFNRNIEANKSLLELLNKRDCFSVFKAIEEFKNDSKIVNHLNWYIKKYELNQLKLF